MRLVFWNCNMALHAKLPLLAELKPDIAVLPECARPDIVRSKAGLFVPESFIWIGDNPHKGLGVVAFGAYRVELASNHDASFRYVAPCHVAGPVAFNLIGLWDYHVGAEKMGRMPGPFRRALDHWQDYLRSAPTIIGGDFNNHVVFDKPVHEGNFAELDAHLRRLGFFSAYHAHHGVELGAEKEPTHYWRDRKRDGWRYHIDHVYLPETLRHALLDYQVGAFDSWIRHSDHMPLIIDLDERAMLPATAKMTGGAV